jgi:hypothetical protein
MRAAVIDLTTSKVVNIVVADAALHAAAEGCVLVNSETANIGDGWDGTRIVPSISALPDSATVNPAITAL